MKTYVMLAPGFEIAEATVPIDIMRRAGIDVQIVSITPFNEVEASNGVVVVADSLLEDTDLSDGDLIFLPGGMPGATNLSDCEPSFGLWTLRPAQRQECNLLSRFRTGAEGRQYP